MTLAKLALIVALITPVVVGTQTAEASTRGCPAPIVAIIRRDFGRAAGWATAIAWRESRCIPTAHNRSGASGLFQMMLPLHARQFTAVGCSPRQWSNAYCNTAAAAHLYHQVGSRPWR